VVAAAAGGVLDEITVKATAEGYAELVEFANHHATLRAWAIEGTGGHRAGLSRHLLQSSEIVIESDRPKRAARRNGAKSDRSMRSALPAKRWLDRGWELPTAAENVKPCRCSWLLAAPRSTPPPRPSNRSSAWSSQHPNPFGLGSVVRSLLRCSTPPRTCECTPPGTPRRPSTVVALRTLARRAHAMLKKRYGSSRRRS